jgi:hypothetical protein
MPKRTPEDEAERLEHYQEFADEIRALVTALEDHLSALETCETAGDARANVLYAVRDASAFARDVARAVAKGIKGRE